MTIVNAISQRSTCDRGKPGCVFVKDNRILTTGYASSPPGLPHCDEIGHKMEAHMDIIIKEFKNDSNIVTGGSSEYGPVHQHCVRTIHAEQNAILQAAKVGIPLQDSICYVSMTPCRTCAMMLISVGVKRIVAGKFYQKSEESIEMFKTANVVIEHLSEEQQSYVKDQSCQK